MLRIVIAAIVISLCWPPPRRPATQPASSRVASQPSGRTVAIKAISRDMLKQWVTIEGDVSKLVTKPSRTRERIYIHTVSQGDDQIEVVWWEPLAKALKDKAPREGDHVRIRGRVDEYRGQLQLAPGEPADVRVLKAARRADDPPP